MVRSWLLGHPGAKNGLPARLAGGALSRFSPGILGGQGVKGGLLPEPAFQKGDHDTRNAPPPACPAEYRRGVNPHPAGRLGLGEAQFFEDPPELFRRHGFQK